ncbi:phosphatidylglycerophosphatase A [Psychromarinibacter halotolerans]|uniref:Phosphatidylglycerophosphatase A n=1 Tax=Psychromarinibacter halotolerans TaxID=1775175 RepID=A0ABV7GST5_9RHOB|nr:phosphatidylglycerophosphatase A [Psychromarinibacter halotolerans]MDF0594779.1 phosphatidylglycerophosphatase A [Psychromarinibacter halotolerans]
MSRAIATFFGVGLLPWAPGTWGSAVAIPVAWVLHGLGGFPLFAAATVLVFVVGWWATAEATRGSDDHDPSEIVIDEVAGIWLALWPLSAGLWHADVGAWVFPWPGWVGAFVMFRLFDIWKPGPVGWADRRGDALGVMLDDVIAGVFAALCVAVAAGISHGLLGM